MRRYQTIYDYSRRICPLCAESIGTHRVGVVDEPRELAPFPEGCIREGVVAVHLTCWDSALRCVPAPEVVPPHDTGVIPRARRRHEPLPRYQTQEEYPIYLTDAEAERRGLPNARVFSLLRRVGELETDERRELLRELVGGRV